MLILTKKGVRVINNALVALIVFFLITFGFCFYLVAKVYL